MTKLTCIAIDDEPLALRVFTTFAGKRDDLMLKATFTNPIDAQSFLMTQSVDLMFLDIDMLQVNGITFAKALSPRPLIIFTTAHREYALDGFDLDAVDYLLKPYNYERFQQAVNKAMARFSQQPLRDFITVFTEYVRKKIFLDEIEYIESMQDYLMIHLIDGSHVLTLGTMKAMTVRLPSTLFMRIHRRYLISVSQIKSVAQKKVLLNNTELSIGDSYYREVIKLLGT